MEKPGPGNEPSDMVNILVHLHSDPETLLHYISQVKTNNDDVYEQAVDAMCRTIVRFRWFPIPELGRPSNTLGTFWMQSAIFWTGRKLKFHPMSGFPRMLSSTAK